MGDAPFKVGDRVIVPGRYRGLVVTSIWRERDVLTERIDGVIARTVLPGDWYVLAEFESGYGRYRGRASEFSLKP